MSEGLLEDPVSESDEDGLEEGFDHIRATLEENNRELTTSITKAARRIETTLEDLDFKTDLKPLLDKQDKFTKVFSERIEEQTAEMELLNGNAKKVYQSIENVTRELERENQDDAWTRKNFRLALAVGIFTAVSGLTGLVAAIAAVVSAVEAGKPPAPTGDPDLDTKLRSLYAYVMNTSDTEFWNQVAVFVALPRSWTLYLADQMAAMNYVISWRPYLGVWNWASGDDKADLVNQLVTAYQTSNAAVYTTVNGFTYAGDPTQKGPVALPRAIAADLVRIALAQIIVNAGNA